jgi:hypothetical protein
VALSISIYYTARRAHGIAPPERVAIESLRAEFSVNDEIDDYMRTGHGLNWESFCVYSVGPRTEPGVVFEGATKLPDNTDDAIAMGVQHWAALLSRIRQALPGATWHVHVDDNDLVWDDDAGEYDLGQSPQ